MIDFDAASPARAPGTSPTSPTASSPWPIPRTRTCRPLADAPARLERLVAAYGAPLTSAAVLEQVPARLDELAATAPDPAHRAIYAKDAAYARASPRR